MKRPGHLQKLDVTLNSSQFRAVDLGSDFVTTEEAKFRKRQSETRGDYYEQ